VYSKIAAQYVVLRKSVRDPHQIVKSQLSIKLSPDKKILSATHRHFDRQGVARQSTGFVIGVVRNLHVFLQVEDGEGIEVISLREPVQTRFLKMMGFMQSINIDRQILSARIFIEREDDGWLKLKHRFVLSDLDHNPDRQRLVAALLDNGPCLTIPDVHLTGDDE
jgi:hypothetical protein